MKVSCKPQREILVKGKCIKGRVYVTKQEKLLSFSGILAVLLLIIETNETIYDVKKLVVKIGEVDSIIRQINR